jgi:hypothetical protein
MADEPSRLRIVGPGDSRNPRRPGPAVVWILVYASLFGAGLIYLRAKIPLLRKAIPETARAGRAEAPAPAADPVQPRPPAEHSPEREALLSGEGVPAAARGHYFQQLATERCNCGCERSIADCLLHEPTCTRSPAIAAKLIQDSSRPPEADPRR